MLLVIASGDGDLPMTAPRPEGVLPRHNDGIQALRIVSYRERIKGVEGRV